MTEATKNASFDSIDALFSANLDDLDDLPSFETPPPGAYILGVTMEVKEINKKQAVEARLVVKETVELKNPEDKPSIAGTMFSQLFMLNEIGIGKLKQFIKPFAEHFGVQNVGALIRDNMNAEVLCSATVKNRKDKEDPEKVYAAVEITGVM